MQVNSIQSSNYNNQPNFKGFIHFTNLEHRLHYSSKSLDVKDLFLNTNDILSVQPIKYFKSGTEARGAVIKTIHSKDSRAGYEISENNLFSDVCNAITQAVKDGFAKFDVKD